MLNLSRRTIQILSIALFACMAVWGIYTLIAYMGVPAHAVLLPKAWGDTGKETLVYLREVCETPGVARSGETAYLCRGLLTIWPAVEFIASLLSPIIPYILISLLIGAGILGYGWLRTQKLSWTIRMRPWMLLVAFIGATWLIFTVLAYTVNISGSIPIRYFVEPVPEVYTNTSPQALAALQQHFGELQSRQCLNLVGQTGNGAGVYEMSFFCMQGSFFTTVLPPLIVILLLAFEFLLLGRFLLSFLRLRLTPLAEAAMSAALGACGVISMLWLLAALHIFHLNLVLGLLFLVPILLWKQVTYWVRRFHHASWEVQCDLQHAGWFFGWLLLSYLAFNYLNVVRPFPIGWDDLGSYLNRPKLLVSYGHFIPSMAQFQWEYLTSLGFLLFGSDSAFGATVAMMINWFAGVLAAAAVYLFASTYLGKGRGLIASLLYYTLPLVGHFSYADMKIDNAIFAMGALAMYAVFVGLFPPETEDHTTPVRRKWLLLAGVLGGFAFSIKPTAIMVVLSLSAVVLGASLHWMAFLGMALLAAPVLAFGGALRPGLIAAKILGSCLDPAAPGSDTLACDVGNFLLSGRIISSGTLLIVVFIVGLLCFIPVLRRHGRGLMRGVLDAAIFFVSCVVVLSPWLLHNNILRSNIIPRFEMGAPNSYSPSIELYDRGPGSVQNYGQPIRILPPELAINPNHPACIQTGTAEELDRYWGFGSGINHYLTLPWRVVMNIDAFGYYVTTMPALLLIPLILLLPFFWTHRGRWLRWLSIATFFVVLQWMFLANGIPWYGLGMFLGLSILLEAFVAHAPDLPNRIIASVLIGISLMLNIGQRFAAFEQQKNMLDYPLGKNSAQAILARTVPYYEDIAKIVTQRVAADPSRPYVYRVGTFIPYFIPKNLEVIGVTDHQLDVFNCMYQERNPALTTRRMKALGFNSIILDTNTATIERTLGSLHQKYNAMVEYLLSPEGGLQSVVQDPAQGIAFFLIP